MTDSGSSLCPKPRLWPTSCSADWKRSRPRLPGAGRRARRRSRGAATSATSQFSSSSKYRSPRGGKNANAAIPPGPSKGEPGEEAKREARRSVWRVAKRISMSAGPPPTCRKRRFRLALAHSRIALPMTRSTCCCLPRSDSLPLYSTMRQVMSGPCQPGPTTLYEAAGGAAARSRVAARAVGTAAWSSGRGRGARRIRTSGRETRQRGLSGKGDGDGTERG
jgi:hypothetical protein